MKDKIISLMRIKGPVLPLDISRSLNTNSIMAGAYLSELVALKSVKISNLKLGGSPLYYLEGQESKLQDYVRVLKPPEKKSYDLLKENKILKDNDLDPVTRVCLQNIKDFAKPIEITFNDQKEKYWKWYMLSNDELQEFLKNKFEKQQPKQEVEKEQSIDLKQTPKQEVKKEQSIEKEKAYDQKQETEIQGHNEDIKEKPKKIESIEKKEQNDDRKIIKKDIQRTSEGHKIIDDEKEIKSNDAFLNKINKLFSEKKIEIINQTIIKSNSEIEFKILIPTSVGKILYYAVAKSKKRCSDADLAQAYVKAEMNKLPVLFIHLGDLTKKANEMLKKEFKIITSYKLD
jgi:hypothetical protein